MEKSIDALIDILQRLNAEYSLIERVEVEKTSVIMKRDGIRLQELTIEQEKSVSSLDELEKKRHDIVQLIARGLGIKEASVTISLLADYMDTDKTHELREASQLLTKTMGRVRRLNELNNKCLTDNIDFFNQIMSSLRESVSLEEGYSSGGTVKRSAGSSALFNRTV